MYQYLLPFVIRFVLGSITKNLPMDEWKQKTKDWVKSVVPGVWFDDAAWSFVESVWDLILDEVQKKYPQGVHHRAGMTEVWKSVADVTHELNQKMVNQGS